MKVIIWVTLALGLVFTLGCEQRSPCDHTNKQLDGKRIGVYVIKDSLGDLQSILNYQSGALNGESVWFHSNGKIRSKVNYIDGKEEGLAYYFYPSGVIECERRWKDGKKIGYAADYYDFTGEIKAVLIYNEDGFLIHRKTFDKKGNLLKEEG